jgi:hypothetical protein
VRDAIVWLERRSFIRLERAPGRPAKVFLQREDGTDRRYVIPAKAPKDKSTGKLHESDWYVRLPASFWTNGWSASLSTAAISILLVMLVLARAGGEWFWISPAEARRRFALSEDTWTRGTAELRKVGLIEVGRQTVSEEFGWKRVRNRYALDLSALDQRAVPRI